MLKTHKTAKLNRTQSEAEGACLDRKSRRASLRRWDALFIFDGAQWLLSNEGIVGAWTKAGITDRACYCSGLSRR